MKCAALLLLLASILLQADALKCRKSSCMGTRPCSSTTVTCSRDATQCFVLMKTQPPISMARGCITPSNCLIMKASEPSTVCCNRDLCN